MAAASRRILLAPPTAAPCRPRPPPPTHHPLPIRRGRLVAGAGGAASACCSRRPMAVMRSWRRWLPLDGTIGARQALSPGARQALSHAPVMATASVEVCACDVWGALGSPPANTPPSPTFRSRVVAARCRTLQPAAVAATHSLLCSCQAARGAGPAQGGGPPSPTGSWIQGRCPTGSARVQDPVPGSSNGRTSVFLVTTAVMAVRRHGAVMAATTRMVAVALLSGRQRQR